MCTLVGFCYHWGDYQCLRGHCPVFCFRSFSLSANPLPVGIPAEGLGSGILQLGVECFSRTDLPPILRESFFLKDIFRLKHFTMHILQPECRRAGRLRAGWKIWRKNKAFRHVDAVMEKTTGQILKSSCSFNENVLFFSEKNKAFKKKNKTFERLVTCMPEG